MKNSFRAPDFSQGRFFVSPILGCAVRCMFCYIYNSGYTLTPTLNEFTIDSTCEYIFKHPEYEKGKGGSIISIGAWGDPLPPTEKEYCISWIKELVKNRNPIQIISRYEQSKHVLQKIKDTELYNNQIMYSTSVSTFSHWDKFEPFSDAPILRFQTLALSNKVGLLSNLMIKPFIPGVTDNDLSQFIEFIQKYSIVNVVAGVFYYDEKIISLMRRKKLLTSELESIINGKDLDHRLAVDEKQKVKSISGLHFDDFYQKLQVNLNFVVFKNSQCVNAFSLKVNHVSDLFAKDSLNLCVKCGNCN